MPWRIVFAKKPWQRAAMCNLYSNTTTVEVIRRLFKVSKVDNSAANPPSQPSIFPAHDGPVIRLVGDSERELTMMHWGFVLPQRDKAPKIVNNCRDDKAVSSPFWKSSFEARRCLIPATSFAEYHPKNRDDKGHETVIWFAMKGDEPCPRLGGFPWLDLGDSTQYGLCKRIIFEPTNFVVSIVKHVQ